MEARQRWAAHPSARWLTHASRPNPLPCRLWHEPGGAVWEPVFVPRPGGRAEDDGVVMSTIMQADGCR